MYYQLGMRRVLSLVFTLFFSLGPLAACFGSGDDARLPACCRRHGTHHCAMADAVQAVPGSAPHLRAPSHCPLYPDGAPASISSVLALAFFTARAASSLEPDRVLFEDQKHPHKTPHRTSAGRGPPTSALACSLVEHPIA